MKKTKRKTAKPRRTRAPQPTPLLRSEDCDPFRGRQRDISTCLQYRFGYSELRAKFCIPEIKALHKSARGPFLTWWRTGEMPDVVIFEQPFAQFAAEIGDPVNAFVWLSRSFIDPDDAAERLKELRDERVDRAQRAATLFRRTAAPRS